jgi:pimeloyl-ACP methyl ester carboxylesterase
MSSRDATTAVSDRQPPQFRFSDVTSDDGTRIRAWTNDAEGPAVLLCNALGLSPYAWPDLLRPDCGVRLWSWNARGTGGSERPADPDRVGVDAFVEDALAVLDYAGIDSCVVMSWSLAIDTAVELVASHPARVAGLLAVAGTPGSGGGASRGVTGLLRQGLTMGVARVLDSTSWFVSPVIRRIPVTPLTTGLLRHSVLMLPRAPQDAVALTAREFLSGDMDWYLHLAMASSRHRRVPLSDIAVPTTFMAGAYDLFSRPSQVRAAAQRIANARLVEVPGTHFLPLELGDRIREELLKLVDRAAEAEVRTAARE